MSTPSTVIVVTFHHEEEGAIYDPMAFASVGAAETYMDQAGWTGNAAKGWEKEPEDGWYESATATTAPVHG